MKNHQWQAVVFAAAIVSSVCSGTAEDDLVCVADTLATTLRMAKSYPVHVRFYVPRERSLARQNRWEPSFGSFPADLSKHSERATQHLKKSLGLQQAPLLTSVELLPSRGLSDPCVIAFSFVEQTSTGDQAL